MNDAKGLKNMLGGLIGGNFHNEIQSFFESILDADNDGLIINDVGGAILEKSNFGLGGILEKLFNKK